MSKMSQLHAELSEQASQLGFQSIEEAEANGYVVDYKNETLVDGREQAHKDYLKRKDGLLEKLERARDSLDIIEVTNPYECQVVSDAMSAYSEAIKFIKEGEI